MRWNPTVVGGEIVALVLEARARTDRHFLTEVYENGEHLSVTVVQNGKDGTIPKIGLLTEMRSLPPKPFVVSEDEAQPSLSMWKAFADREFILEKIPREQLSRRNCYGIRLTPRVQGT